MRVSLDLTTRRRALQLAATAAAVFRPSASNAAQKLEFTTTDSGLRWADIKVGNGDLAVDTGSRVTFHAIGRLVGKQDGSFSCDGPRDGDPLPLAHGKLVRSGMKSVAESDAMQSVRGTGSGLCPPS